MILNSKPSKTDLILCVQKINQNLKKKEVCIEDIQTLQTLFLQYKKPCFLMGLLSMYEKSKIQSILKFIDQNIEYFKEDFSDKINQLFIVYLFWTKQPIESRRMVVSEQFIEKYRRIFPVWFNLEYFQFNWFNPVCSSIKISQPLKEVAFSSINSNKLNTLNINNTINTLNTLNRLNAINNGKFNCCSTIESGNNTINNGSLINNNNGMLNCWKKFYLRDFLLLNEITTKNELEILFLQGYCLTCQEEYLLAINKFNNLLIQLKNHPKNLGLYLHTYHLISFCYFYIGNFIESIFYLEMAFKMYNYKYFTEIIETIKGIKLRNNIYLPEFNTFYPHIEYFSEISVDLLIKKRLIFNLIISENLYLRDLIYENSKEIVELFYKDRRSLKVVEFESLFKRLVSNLNILSIRSVGSRVEFMCYKGFLVQEIEIEYESIIRKYKETFVPYNRTCINKSTSNNSNNNTSINNNRSTANNNRTSSINNSKRKKLDDQMSKLIAKVNDKLIFKDIDYLLINNSEFCFEQCKKLKNTIRIPRISYLYTKLTHKNIPKYFLLDPTNELKNTQKRILPHLNFPGCVGRPLDFISIPNPVNFYYFGHGNGNSFLKNLNFRFLSLFGCSSAKRFFFKGSNPHGLMYRNNVECFVGCLWDVSDKDLDRMSLYFLEGKSKCLEGVKYKFLNGAALVVYGKINY